MTKWRRPTRFLVLAMLPMVCGFANDEGVTSGSLAGTITRGPTCPVQTPSTQCPPEPASGVKLVILTQAGKEVTTLVTDRDGKYSVTLPPASYRIELGPLRGIELTKDLPAALTITAGRTTRLDITIDTGVR